MEKGHAKGVPFRGPLPPPSPKDRIHCNLRGCSMTSSHREKLCFGTNFCITPVPYAPGHSRSPGARHLQMVLCSAPVLSLDHSFGPLSDSDPSFRFRLLTSPCLPQKCAPSGVMLAEYVTVSPSVCLAGCPPPPTPPAGRQGNIEAVRFFLNPAPLFCFVASLST
jgi:hypothetical protein